MFSKKIKPLTIGLFILMILFVAACSSSGSNNGKSNETEVNKPAVTAENQSSPQEKEEVPDLGGRVIRLSAWWDLTPNGESASSKAELEQIAAVEEKYNVNIEFVNVPFDNYVDKFTTTTLAGEPFADIVMLENKAALPAILKGQILPIDEFTDGTSNINNEQNLIKKNEPLGGGYYGFGRPGNSGVSLMYNREIFKQLGLPDLQELYAKGEWSWSKFEEIAKLATKDTNNDGKNDYWGFSGWGLDIARHFAAANGAKAVDDAAGKEGISDPKMIEALEFVNKLYNVDKVVKVKTGNRMEWTEIETFKDGDVAMFMAAEWMVGDLQFDFSIVPIPNGPQGSDKYVFADSAGQGFFIPKGVKDPQLVYKIYEEMVDIPPLEDFPGQTWLEGIYKHQEDIDMVVQHISGRGMPALEDAYPDFPLSSVVEDIISKNASVTSTIDKYKQQAQAAVDALGK
ncbi:ABC transporter substrate-binding protein [Paenibacillus fonticola]|uniref:ABC transporter substrate-binding protein n=1 Tax=Paenibacillus fonticola TaxID=379896 RepID=UPI0003766B28|nr:extracellular solute-binding protein [Paenibacillus fonticola]